MPYNIRWHHDLPPGRLNKRGPPRIVEKSRRISIWLQMSK
jgi:hypothetical protein